MPEIRVEICSACNPFFTGKQKLVDTARRVEKFEERQAKKAVGATRKGKTAKLAAKQAAKKLKLEEK